MSSPITDRFCRLAVNGLIVNPNIYDGGAIETGPAEVGRSGV